MYLSDGSVLQHYDGKEDRFLAPLTESWKRKIRQVWLASTSYTLQKSLFCTIKEQLKFTSNEINSILNCSDPADPNPCC